MTVANVRISRHESLDNWFLVVFTSRKDSIGQTTIELLCSEEEINHFKKECDKALGIKNDSLNWKFGEDGK